jgi:hypothetical protein
MCDDAETRIGAKAGICTCNRRVLISGCRDWGGGAARVQRVYEPERSRRDRCGDVGQIEIFQNAGDDNIERILVKAGAREVQVRQGGFFDGRPC